MVKWMNCATTAAWAGLHWLQLHYVTCAGRNTAATPHSPPAVKVRRATSFMSIPGKAQYLNLLMELVPKESKEGFVGGGGDKSKKVIKHKFSQSFYEHRSSGREAGRSCVG